MRDQAARIGSATLTRYAEVVHAGLGEMRGATAPRLLLEVVCARLLLPSASDTEAALLQRVERIETRLDMSLPADAAAAPQRPRQPRRPPQPKPAPAPAPEPATAPVAGAPDAAAIRRQWSTVLDKVRERSRSLAVMLAGATVHAVEGDTLVLSHQSAPLAKRLGEQRNAEVISEALKDALGMAWQARYQVGPAEAALPDAPADDPVRRDDEDTMLAEAGSDDSQSPRQDPEEAALELLQNELGARRIDGG
jgi:DNA polymerase-3 subunit gamma/tau